MEAGFFYAFGAALAWGLVYTLDELILKTSSPLVLLFIHYGTAALVMLPLIAYLEPNGLRSVVSVVTAQPHLVATTTTFAFMAGLAILAAIKSLDASTASVIEISYPFFVILFSILILRSVPNAAFMIGAVLLFAGSFIIVRYA